MTDDPTTLAERLRQAAWYKRRNGDDKLMREAADALDAKDAEIERLRAAIVHAYYHPDPDQAIQELTEFMEEATDE